MEYSPIMQTYCVFEMESNFHPTTPVHSQKNVALPKTPQ